MRLRGILLAATIAACGGGDGVVPAPGAPPPPPGPPDPLAGGSATFVHWENLSVHPLDVTPDGATLLVCNTADARLELFDLAGGSPEHLGSVPVGLDPVSVRARSATEAWVVNHVSDSVSVVDLPTRRVVDTLATLDEPADVVFAGDPRRAFVSCSQANALQVFDPADRAAAPVTVPIDAEDPRGLAVSADGSRVFAAIFESGNGTTILGGNVDPNATINVVTGGLSFPPGVVSDPAGPYGGVNPPPNAGGGFDPPQRPGNPPPPPVGLIVRHGADDRWRDDTGADWTDLVSGAQAGRSGRPVGWELADRDIAVVDTADLTVTYASQCLNLCMALAVQPGTGRVTVVGTDATNEVRYEPVLQGRFLRVNAASWDPAAGGAPDVVDLNAHLDYATGTIPQAERDRALGDPRGIVWNAEGTRAWVTGMGSNNVVVLDSALARVARIEVGEGPTGIVLAPGGARAYVLNRFEGTVSVLDTAAAAELERVPFFDPTPAAVANGRRHLYGTHETSGLGHTSCASCHVDARMDRLAWDLGDPAGEVKPFDQNCLTQIVQPCEDFHPMKGPMLTQTLQDIIGKEPHHWRGDRDGLEEFNGAFTSLLGDDAGLTPPEMQEFEDFLATIRFPPNPFRNLDNTLPADLPLPGHFTTGRFAPAGRPLPNGDATEGLRLYRTGSLDGGVPGFECSTCHSLPTGMGPDVDLTAFPIEPAPIGPNGERHHAVVSVDGLFNVSIKVPHLRNLFERTGFELTQPVARAGFGFLHDGSIDSIARFVGEPAFSVTSDQQIADLVALMLALPGSDLPEMDGPNEFPGAESLDTHAAVGRQVTFGARRDDALLDRLLALAGAGAVDLVAKGPAGGWYLVGGAFQSDRVAVVHTVAEVRAQARPGNEITFTAVPRGTGRRIGVDRDNDGYGDGDELDSGTDPGDPADTPG